MTTSDWPNYTTEWEGGERRFPKMNSMIQRPPSPLIKPFHLRKHSHSVCTHGLPNCSVHAKASETSEPHTNAMAEQQQNSFRWKGGREKQ